MDHNSFGPKLQKLFKGKRTFLQRLKLAVFPCLAFSFLLFFFGPLDLSYISKSYVSYSALDILPVTSLLMLAVFVSMLVLSSVPGGKVYAFLQSCIVGFTIACYIQGAFLNPDYGTLDGHTVNWTGQSRLVLINLIIWFVIFIIPHLIHYFSNNFWRKFITFTSIVVIFMHVVSLSVKLVDQYKIDRDREAKYFVSTKNILTLGKQQNVVVFLLDKLSNDQVNISAKKYPDILEPFTDFIQFDNANTRFLSTMPSLVDIYTAYDPELTEFNFREHFIGAWNNPAATSFYSALKEKNYEVTLYDNAAHFTRDLSSLYRIFDNFMESKDSMSLDKRAFLNLIKLTFYRYFPVALKPFFMIYTTDINQMFSSSEVMKDQYDFVRLFNEGKLSLADNLNSYKFYYLQGAHTPCKLNENGEIESESTATSATAGFLRLIGRYMEQMKELGVYDDSLIIVLADHGDRTKYPMPAFWIKLPGVHQDHIELNHAPITTQTHFIPTIAGVLGFDNYTYGETVFDVPQDLVTERVSREYTHTDKFPDVGSKRGFNAIVEYHFTGGQKELMNEINNKKNNTNLIPVTLSYY